MSPYPVRFGDVGVSDDALLAIVRGAVGGVDGASLDTPGRVARVLPGRRGPVEWRVEGRSIRVSVDVTAAYGRVLPDVARAVQAAIADAIATMTGLAVRAVDVTVAEVVREAPR